MSPSSDGKPSLFRQDKDANKILNFVITLGEKYHDRIESGAFLGRCVGRTTGCFFVTGDY
jgi:hypothetical protein